MDLAQSKANDSCAKAEPASPNTPHTPGDVIHEFDGRPVPSAAQLKDEADNAPRGRKAPIKLRRGGKEVTVNPQF